MIPNEFEVKALVFTLKDIDDIWPHERFNNLKTIDHDDYKHEESID